MLVHLCQKYLVANRSKQAIVEYFHFRSCEVKMEKTRNTGRIQCSVCMEDFQATINFLSEPIDVYNEWIDACEAANQ